MELFFYIFWGSEDKGLIFIHVILELSWVTIDVIRQEGEKDGCALLRKEVEQISCECDYTLVEELESSETEPKEPVDQ